MGSSVSVIPDKLSEDDVRKLAAEQFDQATFDSLKDQNGLITKEQWWFVAATRSDEELLFDQFIRFAPSGEMDSKTFAKLCRDTNLYNKLFSTGDADIIFSSAKAKQSNSTKGISFDSFRNICIPAIATKKGKAEAIIISKITRVDGPTFNATIAEPVRLHDDPSTFTGQQRRRSSESMPPSPDRRGSKVNASLDPMFLALQDARSEYESLMSSSPNNSDTTTSPLKRKSDITSIPETTVPLDLPNRFQESELMDMYSKYCPTGDMDSMTFIKLCKDTGLLDTTATSTSKSGGFRLEEADILYMKGKAALAQKQQGVPAKYLNFDIFRQVCVPAIAAKKGMSVTEVMTVIGEFEGPEMSSKGVNPFSQDSENSSRDRRASLSTISDKIGNSNNVNTALDNNNSNNKNNNNISAAASNGAQDASYVSPRRRASVENNKLLPRGNSLPVPDSGSTPASQKRPMSRGVSVGAGDAGGVSGVAARRSSISALGDNQAKVAAGQTLTRGNSKGGSRRNSLTGDAQSTPSRKASLDQGRSRRGSMRGSFSNSDTAALTQQRLDEPYTPNEIQMQQLRTLFNSYATDERQTASQFIKLMREGQLLTKVYNTVEAEIIHMEARRKAGKLANVASVDSLSFQEFYEYCLPAIARKREENFETLIRLLAPLSTIAHQSQLMQIQEKIDQLPVYKARAETVNLTVNSSAI